MLQQHVNIAKMPFERTSKPDRGCTDRIIDVSHRLGTGLGRERDSELKTYLRIRGEPRVACSRFLVRRTRGAVERVAGCLDPCLGLAHLELDELLLSQGYRVVGRR